MPPSARLLPILLAASLLASTTALAASLSVTSAKLTAFTKTYGSPVTCTLSAAADAYVDHANQSTNYGSAVTLAVASATTAERRTFVRFELANCSPAIPATAIVQSATLQLTTAMAAAATRTYELRRAQASWNEVSIRWVNQPGAGSVTASTAVVSGTSSGTVISWSAISDVQSFITGAATNNGWRLSDSAEGSGSATLNFNSREAASGHPQLVITYVS